MRHHNISGSFVRLMLVGGFMSIIFLLGNSDTVIDPGNLQLTTDSTQGITTNYTETVNTTPPAADPVTTTQDSSSNQATTAQDSSSNQATTAQDSSSNQTQPITNEDIANTQINDAITQAEQNPSQDPTATPGERLTQVVSGTTNDTVPIASGDIHPVSTGVNSDPFYAPKMLQFPAIDLLALLKHPRIQQYQPGNHIGALDDPGYIVYASSDLAPLAYEGLVTASFSDNASGVQELFIGTDIFYRSYDNQIQIKLPEGLQIKANDGKPFSTHDFDLEPITGMDGVFTVQIYDHTSDSYAILEQTQIENDNKEEFHFGVSGEHLVFSKPLEVKVFSDAPNGTLVDIMANHANQGRTKDGLATNPNTQCNNGNATIPGSVTTVQDNIVSFYICGASIFALTYTGGANSANFADGGFKDKAVNFLTGTHFPTGSTINDISISIDRQPIDGRDPTNPGLGSCSPSHIYFTLTHNTGGTAIGLINSGQLTSPTAYPCPRVTTNFANSATLAITGRYYTASFLPTSGQSLTTFNGEAPFGSWILRMGDTTNDDGVILHAFTVTIDASTGGNTLSGGAVCIYMPDGPISGSYDATAVTGIFELDFGGFELDDPLMAYTGYYTTLSLGPLINKFDTGIVIGLTGMERKATSVVQLTGITNTTVRIDTGWLTYTGVQVPRTFLLRDDGVGAGRTGRRQSNVWIKVTMPPYLKPGPMASTITYTLYSN